MIIIKTFVLIGYFYILVKSKNVFMPNLPVGEYRTVIEKMYSCQSTNSIQFHVYLNKRTSNITEIKGNLSVMMPFDDSFTLDVNAASWSLTGGWKPNSMVYLSKNACRSLKMFAGNAWYSVIKAFNIPRTSCPLPAGTYTTSGMDLKELEGHNFPKVYFYGKYKFTFKLKNEENKVHCCVVLELSLIRPWEKPF
uniref:MD-2-related lipid-recognition domain-containing protein n=1 Tax=Schizaphis graminum TaxID=13262 RepID=A0A2S2P1L1_SCHGA